MKKQKLDGKIMRVFAALIHEIQSYLIKVGDENKKKGTQKLCRKTKS